MLAPTDIARTRPTRRLIAPAAIAFAALAWVGTTAESRPAPRAAAPAATPSCPEAGRTRVQLPDADAIDGIRIFVADAPEGTATDVTILAGGRDRTLRAFAPGVFGLLLDEPLPAHSRTIEVALEPVLEATGAACVARVELLRRGAVVGTAEIR